MAEDLRGDLFDQNGGIRIQFKGEYGAFEKAFRPVRHWRDDNWREDNNMDCGCDPFDSGSYDRRVEGKIAPWLDARVEGEVAPWLDADPRGGSL